MNEHMLRVKERKGRREVWQARGIGLAYPPDSWEAKQGRRHRLRRLHLAGGR